MKTVVLLLNVFFVTLIFSQQPFGQQWAARYNGPGNGADWASAIVVDNSGNVYTTGYSTGAGTGRDLFTVKYNPSGVEQWTARYNGPVNGGDYSFAITLDASGNVYVTGRSDRGASFLSDYTTIKYNNNGVQQWVALYDGPDHSGDEACAICVDGSGNVYITGKSYSVASVYNIATVKYNSSGVQQWVSVFNGAANNEDFGISIAVDPSGNVYVGGSSVGAGLDIVLIKINQNGVTQWTKSYNGPVSGGDGTTSMKLDPVSGNIYISGFSDGGSATSYDYVTLKYDPAGNQVWARRFNGPSSRTDIANAMTLDANGNVFVTGTSLGLTGNADSNFATIKYTPAGVHVWTAIYERVGMASDVSRAIATDQAGNIYVTGNSSLIGSTDDYTTIKYSPAGEQQWLLTYNGPDNKDDMTSSIAVDNNGYVFVTGKSFSQSSNFDYATIKYSNLVGINQNGSKIPTSFNLYQNYPNPFNPATKIKFDLADNTGAKIEIYNSLGAIIMSADFGFKHAGQYEYTFDAGNLLSSGVYFYKLKAGDFESTKKMILVK